MAYTQRFVQYVFGGSFAAGTVDQDVWQFGLKVPLNGAIDVQGSDAGMTTLANDAANDFATFWNTINGKYSSRVRPEWVKANIVGTDGKYQNTSKTYQHVLAVNPGTSGGEMLPADVALAVTLTTGAARGRGSKGRFYLPAPSTSAVFQGRIDPQVVTLIGNAAKTFVTNIGNRPGLDAAFGYQDVSVMSALGEGVTRPVTGLKIGDLFDTQQRRSNRMREVYTAFPL